MTTEVTETAEAYTCPGCSVRMTDEDECIWTYANKVYCSEKCCREASRAG